MSLMISIPAFAVDKSVKKSGILPNGKYYNADKNEYYSNFVIFKNGVAKKITAQEYVNLISHEDKISVASSPNSDSILVPNAGPYNFQKYSIKSR